MTEQSLVHLRSHRAAGVLLAALALAMGLCWYLATSRVALSAEPTSSSVLLALQDGFAGIVDKVKPAVVNISTEETRTVPGMDDELRRLFGLPAQPRREKLPSLGSGAIIRNDGYILTAAHVVQDLDSDGTASGQVKITVTLTNGDDYKGDLIATDPRTDLAIIKIKADKPLPTVALGDADKLRIGQWAIAIGSPFGYAASVTVGVISGTQRAIGGESEGPRNMLQTDAPINPGNSGGPLVNINGEIIGVNRAIISPVRASIGLGFAVAIDGDAKRVIETLIKGKPVTRGRVGVTVQDLSPHMAELYGVKDGAYVNQVVADSPAQKAGLREQDIIVQVGGTKVANSNDLIGAVEWLKPGTTVTVKFYRDKKLDSRDVTIGEMPSEAVVGSETRPSGAVSLGLSTRAITPQLKQHYRLEYDAGVVVTAVDPEGNAADSGIQAGDVILDINRQAIRDLDGYRQAEAKLKPNGFAIIRLARGNQVFTIEIGDLSAG